MEWLGKKKKKEKTEVSLGEMLKDAQAFIDAFNDKNVSREDWQKNIQKKAVTLKATLDQAMPDKKDK